MKSEPNERTVLEVLHETYGKNGGDPAATFVTLMVAARTAGEMAGLSEENMLETFNFSKVVSKRIVEKLDAAPDANNEW